MSTVRLTRLKIIGIILFALVIYNEWISFHLKASSWVPLMAPDTDEELVKMLIVADPQILSPRTEGKFPFNHIAVIDANRFVSRSYSMAVSYVNPDLVVFLGDVINDGSVSSSDEFQALSRTFLSLFPIPNGAKPFYVAGDNDIGGEGADPVTREKMDRFRRAFNATDALALSFVRLYHLNVIPGADVIQPWGASLSPTPPSSSASPTLSFLFSHFPLLPAVQESSFHKIKSFNPSMIFSAHDHDSYRFVGRKSAPQADQFWVLRDEGKSWTVNLTGDELQEISVPTCSYRMGKRQYGFGFAVVSRRGVLEYTVLWLPSRFTQLWCYFWGLCLCIGLLVYPFCVQCHAWFCSSQAKSPLTKYHRLSQNQ